MDSPFSLDRFEYDEKHLFFLPEDTFTRLEGLKPSYLIGSRGTGKTTLLHALTWNEQLNNKSLVKQLKNDSKLKNYIGVYFKLPKFVFPRFEKWLGDYDENIKEATISLYIDLIWIELLASALSELVVKNIFKAKPEEEDGLINSIIEEFPEIKNYFPASSLFTLMSLKRAIKKVRRKLEDAALYKDDFNNLRECVPFGGIGSFGHSIAKLMGGFCDKYDLDNPAKEDKWHFKICMDEAECLPSFHLKVLNTAVRISEFPLFFVIAFVSLPSDITSTLIPSLTQQKADRNLIFIEAMGDKEFKGLAEGVATIRIQERLNNDAIQFNVENIFGKLSIDQLIFNLLKESTSPEARKLLELAEPKNLPELLLEEYNKRKTVKSIPPLYKVYIIDRLKIRLPSSKEPRWKKRGQDSAELRKKISAAYLGLCKEFNLKVKYAFSDMLLQMSDKCIRDFLSQTHEVFIESSLDLSDFIKTQVGITTQNEGLKRASKNKKESIPKSGVKCPVPIGSMVDGLALLTEMVQAQGSNYSYLRSPEKGRFILETDGVKGSEENGKILELIQDAAEAGFLKIISNEFSKWEFQVHCSLAAHYNFSYRGAYYRTPILFSDLLKIITLHEPESRKLEIQKIGVRLCDLPDPDQFQLFEDRL